MHVKVAPKTEHSRISPSLHCYQRSVACHAKLAAQSHSTRLIASTLRTPKNGRSAQRVDHERAKRVEWWAVLQDVRNNFAISFL